MNLAAKIISSIFHPVLMPTLGLLLIFNTDTYINYAVPTELKQFILMLVAMTTVIIPLLITLLLLNRGFINSLQMHSKKERTIPYAFTIVFYIFMLYMLTKVPVPPIIFNFIIGATISVIAAFAINLKWKISAHMIGVGGLVGALFCIAFVLEANITLYIIFALIIAGLIGTSRLILKAHTPLQVYTGFFLGILCQVLVFI
jgi:membrane-associated phospholipid phosphatase